MFTANSAIFDLNVDTTKSITLPTLAITSQTACNFVVTWKLYRVSDDVDMQEVMPSVFAIDSSILIISHTLSDTVTRKALCGVQSYYF